MPLSRRKQLAAYLLTAAVLTNLLGPCTALADDASSQSAVTTGSIEADSLSTGSGDVETTAPSAAGNSAASGTDTASVSGAGSSQEGVSGGVSGNGPW